MIQFASFKANYKTLKCYVVEMYFMQIFNKFINDKQSTGRVSRVVEITPLSPIEQRIENKMLEIMLKFFVHKNAF
jgi:hypothetical protein